jgi:hypothetical protein
VRFDFTVHGPGGNLQLPSSYSACRNVGRADICRLTDISFHTEALHRKAVGLLLLLVEMDRRALGRAIEDACSGKDSDGGRHGNAAPVAVCAEIRVEKATYARAASTIGKVNAELQ